MGYTVAGTTITIYDDNDGTGGHAVGQTHTPEEVNAFIAAQFVDLGVTPKTWNMKYSIAFGSAAGNNLTTFTASKCNIEIDAGRNFTINAGKGPYVRVYLGEKVGSGFAASGKRNVTIRGGGNHFFACNIEAYQCFFEPGTGSVQFGTQAGVDTIVIVNSVVNTPTVCSIGVQQDPIAEIYNLDATSESTTLTPFNTFSARRAERITAAIDSGVGFFLWGSVSNPNVKDLVMIGNPSACIRFSGAGPTGNAVFVNSPWPESIPRFPDNALFPLYGVAPFFQEWWTLELQLQDLFTHDPVAGARVELLSGNGTLLFDVVSDANGNVIFGDQDTIFANAVQLFYYYRDPVAALKYAWENFGPFTLRVNRDGVLNYAAHTETFRWPYRNTAYGPQARPLSRVVNLVPLTKPNWQEINADEAA